MRHYLRHWSHQTPTIVVSAKEFLFGFDLCFTSLSVSLTEELQILLVS